MLPTEGAPAAIAIVQGNEQIGRAGEALAEPVVARVTDARGRPVIGAPVTLSVTSGEATVTPEGARTDGEGDAAFDLVLGARTGDLLGRVAVVSDGGETIAQADLRLTAVSADAAGISLAAGDGQTGRVGAPLPAPLVVQVADVFGNPIAGVPIQWSVEGGGTVSAEVVETDADGRASVERTLGLAAGEQRTRAAPTAWPALPSLSPIWPRPARPPGSRRSRATDRVPWWGPPCRTSWWFACSIPRATRYRGPPSPGWSGSAREAPRRPRSPPTRPVGPPPAGLSAARRASRR